MSNIIASNPYLYSLEKKYKAELVEMNKNDPYLTSLPSGESLEELVAKNWKIFEYPCRVEKNVWDLVFNSLTKNEFMVVAYSTTPEKDNAKSIWMQGQLLLSPKGWDELEQVFKKLISKPSESVH